MFNDIKSYHSLDKIAIELIASCLSSPDDKKIQEIADTMAVNSGAYLRKSLRAYQNGKLSEEQLTRLYAADALLKASEKLSLKI